MSDDAARANTPGAERFLGVQFVVRGDGIDQEKLLDDLQALLGCGPEAEHDAKDCPMVTMASSGGTYEQVSAWCDGVYPAERRRLLAEVIRLRTALAEVHGMARRYEAHRRIGMFVDDVLVLDLAEQSDDTAPPAAPPPQATP